MKPLFRRAHPHTPAAARPAPAARSGAGRRPASAASTALGRSAAAQALFATPRARATHSSATAALRLAAALGAALLLAPLPVAGADWIPFEANWSAAGTEHTVTAGERAATTFELRGPYVVTSGEGLSRGFSAEALGFVERGVVGIGVLVLTDERGDQIWSRLRGQRPGTGTSVEGTITGGTGRYVGLEGSFRFDWQYVVHTDDGSIQARAVASKGRYRHAETPSPTPAEGRAP